MVVSEHHHRPPYPAASTSAFQHSSNSLYSAHSASSSGSSSNIPMSPGRNQSYNPPLPSPTLEQGPFFGNMSQSTRQGQQTGTAVRHQQHQQQVAAQQAAAVQQYQQYQQQQHQQYQAQQQQYQQQQQQQQQQAYQHQQHSAHDNYTYQLNRQGAGSTAGETNAYINNYALIAEAAKRAQMAVLERDFGGVDLS